MKTPPHPATVRMVPAAALLGSFSSNCTGCIYNQGPDAGGCTFPRKHHEGTKYYCRGWDGRRWIFIEKTDEAHAAYTALILEHGPWQPKTK